MSHEDDEDTKEVVYDAEINPLMTEIIAICKEHKIAMLATFAIPNQDDEGLICTTALLDKSHDPPEVFLEALALLRAKPVMLAETITTNPDGSKHITITKIS